MASGSASTTKVLLVDNDEHFLNLLECLFKSGGD